MSSQSMQEQEWLLAQVEALAETQVEAAERPLFRRFLRHYYEVSSLDALRQRRPEELFRICLGHWQLARQRGAGELKLSLAPPQGGRGLASLDTVVEDMPFLVDSLSMALRGAGCAIDWTAHPVLALRRDAAGQLQQLRPVTDHEPGAESLVHLEFEPPRGEAAYTELEAVLREVVRDLSLIHI